MTPQIYMWSGYKERFLKRHDFFVAQIKERVLKNFSNIEEEAEKYAHDEYHRIGALPGSENFDMADAADFAFDRAQDFAEMLYDMKTQMNLGALAALYHQWDKDLRSFIEGELNHSFDKQIVYTCCWHPNIGEVFDVLLQFGWDIRQLNFFPDIDSCRLIVNVYKHGKGRSLDELAKSYPKYLKGTFSGSELDALLDIKPNYETLALSDSEFDDLANALRNFWVEFPERLYLKGKNSP